MTDMREKLTRIVCAKMGFAYENDVALARETADAIIAALPDMVTPLEWDDEPIFETDEYGCKVWGEFSTDSIVATCKTIYCGIYKHSFDKFMWVDGTLDNIRYSTYRKPPVFETVEIPWLSSIEAAKAAAQADYARRILSALGVGETGDD